MEFPPNSDVEETLRPSPLDRNDTLLKKYDIPIAHLDFKYVEACNDGKELERILHILQSGEEGHYPQLMTATEERIKLIKPNSRFIRKVTPVVDRKNLDTSTAQQIRNELNDFIQNTSQYDSALGQVKEAGKVELPKIRKSTNNPDEQKTDKLSRIKSTDYAAWDKYDPETEMLKMDLHTEQLQKESKQKEEQEEVKEATELVDVSLDESYTETEAALLAAHERLKGNEFYKAGEFKDALRCYSKSIKIHESLEGYTNRAQVQIKLNNFKEAINDSRRALMFDPDNVKANYRLARSLYEVHCYEEAIQALERVIYIDPNNTNAQSLLNTILLKYKKDFESETPQKTRMQITEVSSTDSVSSSVSASPKLEARKQMLKRTEPASAPSAPKKKEPVLVPIPGPSHMPEPYYIVMDDDDPETIKKVELMLYNKPQVMYVYHPPDSSDEDVGPSSDNINCNNGNSQYYDRRFENAGAPLSEMSRRMGNYSRCRSAANVDDSNEESSDEENYFWPVPTKGKCKKRSSEVEIVEIPNETESVDDVTFYARENSEKSEQTDVDDDDVNSETINNNVEGSTSEDENINDENNNLDGDGGGGEPHSEANNNGDASEVEDIETPYSFLVAWTGVQRDATYAQHAAVMRTVTGERLNDLIGNKLDGTMLTDILRTLYLHFTVPHEVERVHAILASLTSMSRFNIVSLFLAQSDRERVHCLFEFLEQHGMPLAEDIKRAYA